MGCGKCVDGGWSVGRGRLGSGPWENRESACIAPQCCQPTNSAHPLAGGIQRGATMFRSLRSRSLSRAGELHRICSSSDPWPSDASEELQAIALCEEVVAAPPNFEDGSLCQRSRTSGWIHREDTRHAELTKHIHELRALSAAAPQREMRAQTVRAPAELSRPCRERAQRQRADTEERTVGSHPPASIAGCLGSTRERWSRFGSRPTHALWQPFVSRDRLRGSCRGDGDR